MSKNKPWRGPTTGMTRMPPKPTSRTPSASVVVRNYRGELLRRAGSRAQWQAGLMSITATRSRIYLAGVW